MSFSVATVGPDGKVVLKCVDSPKKVDDKKSADEEQYPEE
jgi:hypothetical protein